MLNTKVLLILFMISLCLQRISAKNEYSQGGSNVTGIKDSIDYYLLESELLIDSNPKESSLNAFKAYSLSEKFKYPERHAYASRLLGEAKFNIKEYYDAEKHLINALLYYKDTRKRKIIADLNYLLGLTRYSLHKYDDAFNNLEFASQIYHKLNNQPKYASCLQNMGLIYNNKGEFIKAREKMTEALHIFETVDDDKNTAELNQNIGIICFKQNEDSLALYHYSKAINYFKKDHNLNGMGINYSNIGLTLQKKKNYSSAIKQFEKANTYFIKTDYFIGQMWAYNNIGASWAMINNSEEAQTNFLKSLSIASKLKNNEGILSNYKDLSFLYEQTGDYKKSLHYTQLHNALNDSLNLQQSANRINELESLYQLESKEKELAQSEARHNSKQTRHLALFSILFIIIISAIIIVTALAHRRKIEERLARHKKNLQKLVDKRTQELQQEINERKVAEESDKLKSAFLANMSHELRTPMNAIIAFSNFLRQPDLDEEHKAEYLDHISSAGDSLLSLIDDIIDIAKIESQQLKLYIQPTNITRLLNELFKVFSELRIKNNKNHIQFNLKLDKKYSYIINTDTNRLKQVISNLLENAFKYTDDGSIELGFEAVGTSARFWVSDTGRGIPIDKQEAIFDRFYQLKLNNDKRTTTGTGLGLAICKNLIKLLGGTISVESEPRLGSKFIIDIPVDSIKKQVNTSKAQTNKKNALNNPIKYNWNNITILVAEDEDLNYKVLDTCLSRTQANIIRARDGKSAVEIFKNQKIDLVLMDIQMPGMDGYEATQEIKKLNNRTPVIAQTSFAMIGEKERCLQAGCDDFITKPLKIEVLLEKLKAHIMAPLL